MMFLAVNGCGAVLAHFFPSCSLTFCCVRSLLTVVGPQKTSACKIEAEVGRAAQATSILGQKDHINMKILRSCSKAQDKGDSRKHDIPQSATPHRRTDPGLVEPNREKTMPHPYSIPLGNGSTASPSSNWPRRFCAKPREPNIWLN